MNTVMITHIRKKRFEQAIFEKNGVLAQIKSDSTLDERTQSLLIEYYSKWIDFLEKDYGASYNGFTWMETNHN